MSSIFVEYVCMRAEVEGLGCTRIKKRLVEIKARLQNLLAELWTKRMTLLTLQCTPCPGPLWCCATEVMAEASSNC